MPGFLTRIIRNPTRQRGETGLPPRLRALQLRTFAFFYGRSPCSP